MHAFSTNFKKFFYIFAFSLHNVWTFIHGEEYIKNNLCLCMIIPDLKLLSSNQTVCGIKHVWKHWWRSSGKWFYNCLSLFALHVMLNSPEFKQSDTDALISTYSLYLYIDWWHLRERAGWAADVLGEEKSHFANLSITVIFSVVLESFPRSSAVFFQELWEH